MKFYSSQKKEMSNDSVDFFKKLFSFSVKLRFIGIVFSSDRHK